MYQNHMTNSQCDKLQVHGLDCSEDCTGIAGFETRSGLIFFQGLISQLIKSEKQNVAEHNKTQAQLTDNTCRAIRLE